jgi:hypothetical protein
MLYPDKDTAEKELEIAGTMNPGPWTDHSRYAALACRNIAERVPGMNPDKAYITGLLHDIGRREGIMQERHMLEGYRFCAARGWTDTAKTCVTHSFPIHDIRSTLGKWDMPEADFRFIGEFLGSAEYDDYDRLIQLCDSLAIATGFCLLEKRFVDVCMRYGVNEHVVPRWKAIFGLKDYFERIIGSPIYDVLPGVRENTFA